MKNIIITAVVSVLATVFCYHAYEVYQIRATVIQHQDYLSKTLPGEISAFIKQEMEKNQNLVTEVVPTPKK